MDKNRQVEEVLLSPIIVTKYSCKNNVRINKKGKIIESTQTYYPYKNYKISLDPDMSDFTIGFYEIIYKDILEDPIISKTDALSDTEFAGDTMNSFNTIANRIPEAGRSNYQRTAISEWPDYLQKYYLQYHCLANFWILPMVIGRKFDNEYCKAYYDELAIDGGIQDYMDRFLQKVKNSFSMYRESYPKYFCNVNTFEDFLSIHFVNDVYTTDGVISSFSSFEPKKVVEMVTEKIFRRANVISNSQYMEELWEYFNSNGLI